MKHIELINAVSQTVTSGNKIALGNVNIKLCNGAFSYNGTDTLTLVQPGVYQIIVKADLIGTVATQVVSYAIGYNGTVSSVASATSVTAEIGDTITLSIPKLVKICNAPISITLVNDGVDSTTYNNIILDVVKVA